MTWLSMKELAGLKGMTLRGAQRWAKKNAETRYASSDRGGGNGGKVLQVSFESLPEDLQREWLSLNGKPRSTKPMGRGGPFIGTSLDDTPSPAEPVKGGSLVPMPERRPAPLRAVEDPPKKSSLTPAQQKAALARADLVRFIRERKAIARVDGHSGIKAAREALNLYNNGFILQDVFNAIGKADLRTVYRWDKELKGAQGDYSVLAPRNGDRRRGKSSLTDIEREIFLRALLQPQRLSIGSAARISRELLRLQYGIAPSASPAAYRRFAESYRDQNYHVWVMAREGEKALDDKVLPYIERDRNLIEVGQVLVADGHKLNFQVLNPWTGKPGRAMLVMFFDWRSAYPCGFEIMMTEETQCIQSAFRRAVLTLGRIPGHALIDNGRAFKAKVFTSRVDLEGAGIYGLYARLGIKVRFSAPYNAKDKVIERFFQTFSEWIERMMPSYCGSSVGDKPAYMLRNEKFHKALHNPATPSIEQAVKLVQAGIDFYVREPHGGLGGRTPIEVFGQGKGPGVDAAELNHLMMSVDVKTLYRNGVRMFGGHYWDEALVGLREGVIVRYDYQDLSKVRVYGMDGSFLCEARRTYRYDPLMRGDDRAAMKQAMKEKGEMKRQIARAVKAVHGATERLPIDWQRAVEAVPDVAEVLEAASAEAASLPPAHPAAEHAPEPIFHEAFERYEHLMGKESLTKEETRWMREYETTDEYRTIFIDLRQAI